MKKIFFKIASINLALLVLFSTFSFTVEKHFCGDFLMDISYIGAADDCGMQMEAKAINKKKSCCKDEIHKVEGQDELQQDAIVKIDFKKQQFLVSFLFYDNDLFKKRASKNTFYKELSPPDIPLDYQVVFQTFLI
jgi:hypothetical protein